MAILLFCFAFASHASAQTREAWEDLWGWEARYGDGGCAIVTFADPTVGKELIEAETGDLVSNPNYDPAFDLIEFAVMEFVLPGMLPAASGAQELKTDESLLVVSIYSWEDDPQFTPVTEVLIDGEPTEAFHPARYQGQVWFVLGEPRSKELLAQIVAGQPFDIVFRNSRTRTLTMTFGGFKLSDVRIKVAQLEACVTEMRSDPAFYRQAMLEAPEDPGPEDRNDDSR